MYMNLTLTGLIIVISSLSIRLTRRFKMPILAIYLFLGMLLGYFHVDFGFFGSFPDTQLFSTIALSYILFSAGIEMDFQKAMTIRNEGFILATVGILITTGIIGICIKLLFHNFSWAECLLFGTIVSSTDSAAVIAALDFRQVNISERIKTLLKFESGSNDPMAYTMVLFFLSILTGTHKGVGYASIDLVVELLVGFLWGIFFAKMGMFLLLRLSAKIYEFDNILILGLVILSFAASSQLYGNGFLTVYIFGLFLSKDDFQYKKNTVRFYSTLSGILQIFMFIGLGILVDIKHLLLLTSSGIILACILMFIARPVAVFLSLALFGHKFSFKEKIFVSWGGLKGAVPIIFAIYPVVAHATNGITIFHLVFFCVLFSIILQSLTLDNLANALNIPIEEKEGQEEIPTAVTLNTIEKIENNLVEIKVMQQPFLVDQSIKDIALPSGTIIVTIERDDHYFSPSGSTVLQEGDIIFIMSQNKEELQQFLREKFQEGRAGHGSRL